MPQARKLEITQHDLSLKQCDISHAMAAANDPGEVPPLYTLLSRIRPEGLTEAEWARRAEVSSSFFQDVKKGRRPRSDNLEKVVEAVGMSPAQFYALEAPVRSEVKGTGINTLRDVQMAYRGDKPLKPLPHYGSAIGGTYDDLEEHIELVELHGFDVLDWIARPASLATDPEAYVLTILSDSMAPKFEPGARVAVSPRAPAAIGDYVIVQLRGRNGDDDRVKLVLVKRLVRRSAGFVELCQFNPEITFRIESQRVAAMHKVVGEIF
jgi:phage repressor protein C with HTH and peptisase S24 domain